jgi:hypothetical protein
MRLYQQMGNDTIFFFFWCFDTTRNSPSIDCFNIFGKRHSRLSGIPPFTLRAPEMQPLARVRFYQVAEPHSIAERRRSDLTAVIRHVITAIAIAVHVPPLAPPAQHSEQGAGTPDHLSFGIHPRRSGPVSVLITPF